MNQTIANSSTEQNKLLNTDQVSKLLSKFSGTTVKDIEPCADTRVILSPDQVILKPTKHSKGITVAMPAVDNLFKFAGAPITLRTKLQEDTMGRVLGELLEEKEKISLVMEDGKVIDFLKYGERHAIPVDRALSCIDKAAPGAQYHRAMILPDQVVSLEMVAVESEAIARGDLIRAGTRIVFSPYGHISPEVLSYVVRLACTNGMQTEDVFGQFGKGFRSGGSGGGFNGSNGGRDNGNVYNFFKRGIQRSVKALAKIRDRFQTLMGEHITPAERVMVIESLIKEAKLSNMEAQAMRDYAMANPPNNAFEAMSALTWITSNFMDPTEEPRRILRAERVATDYLTASTHSRACPVCRRDALPAHQSN